MTEPAPQFKSIPSDDLPISDDLEIVPQNWPTSADIPTRPQTSFNHVTPIQAARLAADFYIEAPTKQDQRPPKQIDFSNISKAK